MMCMHLFQHCKKWCFVDVMVSCMECFIYKCLDCRCLLHAACCMLLVHPLFEHIQHYSAHSGFVVLCI